MYAGKDAPHAAEISEVLSLASNLNHAKKIVERLIIVFMDIYYTSPKLFTELDLLETSACGTLCVNRKGVPDAIKQKRKLRQNEVIYRRNENLLAVKFHDKRDIHMISHFHEAIMAVLKKQVYGTDNNVTKPTANIDYVKHMEGVDLSDQFNNYNTVMRKSQKWWKKLFFHLLNVWFLSFPPLQC